MTPFEYEQLCFRCVAGMGIIILFFFVLGEVREHQKDKHD